LQQHSQTWWHLFWQGLGFRVELGRKRERERGRSTRFLLMYITLGVWAIVTNCLCEHFFLRDKGVAQRKRGISLPNVLWSALNPKPRDFCPRLSASINFQMQEWVLGIGGEAEI
jgi:hypothetical protein